MKIIRKKIKINKALIASLVVSSLAMSSLAITQTIASNSETEYTNYSIARLAETDSYSDEAELELNSASEYSEKVMEDKEKYKEIFEEKIGKTLKKASNEDLKTFSDRIEDMLEQIKDSDNMDTKKQEKLLSQLLALKEIIENILEENIEYSIDLDLERLFEI